EWNGFEPDGGEAYRWIQRVLKNGGDSKQGKYKKAHELPEDVAQRHQIQKADGVEEAFVFQIFPDFRFERLEISEDIAVRDHHAPGLGGGTRGEDNLQRGVASQPR